MNTIFCEFLCEHVFRVACDTKCNLLNLVSNINKLDIFTVKRYKEQLKLCVWSTTCMHFLALVQRCDSSFSIRQKQIQLEVLASAVNERKGKALVMPVSIDLLCISECF